MIIHHKLLGSILDQKPIVPAKGGAKLILLKAKLLAAFWSTYSGTIDSD